MSDESIPPEIVAFRRARVKAVCGPLGDAALVRTAWIEALTPVDGFPGEWDVVPDDPLTLCYTPAGDVTADGAPVVGPITIRPAAQGGPALHYGQSLRATVLHWPGLGLAVRLWDAAAAADVAGIETYPYEAAWRLEGTYTPHDRTVDYAYHGHGGRLEGRHVVGEVALAIEGRGTTLLVTRNVSGLTTVFGDATNRGETYGGGRFVAVAASEGGRAVVDFNTATLPPCAFSPHFDCPLPPPQNVVQGRIPAGEKRIIRR